MSEGQVFHGTHKGIEVLRYLGDIRHDLCIALDRYVNHLLEQPGLSGFVIDLTNAEAIDSTNLGILARLARSAKRLGLPKVIIISNRPNITEVLEAVGFDRVFSIVDHYPAELERLMAIPNAEGEELQSLQLMLDAHRELVSLSKDNELTFKDVIAAFEKELNALK